ncbi:DNA polymerase III subunit gamma and tau [Cryobacterium sp. PH31-AA6]|uniref:DNA polymerase III subunit gamma and tau n=1 Tax=Cryobacterium sp. PH31-AA6 TaxID=3046205 RepID=UPI0024BA5B0B|nr:DNA polymerase III subunit gamma and tau [Cryobacterium sp. PH31-AA6]MDJ0323919.1 DNA polymerase III subunit gamma and tau [Cryobacterium sp. PH31-AA6]
MVTALYRRYRPETFAEMIGQSQVTDPLMTALRTNRVNHAYLFSGPRGCGKTTSARILARCLNCAEGPTDTPCGVCPSCVELSRDGGGSLDVVEIDAASHNGVDDARDIRERAIFAPARDRYKIFILDEAHMVTPQGFNALLKIVEEPPEHVKFIFATTEPEKVIGTIRSRTHHYPFRLVPPGPMLEYVQTLCESETMTVAPGVLPLVVRAGGGSPRDTLSLLDQLMAGSDGHTVEYERAVALLGYTNASLLDESIDAIAARDSSAAFDAVDRVIQTGQDPRRFVEDLLERMRDLIIVAATSAAGAAAVLRGVPQDELDRMAVQAAKFGPAELSRTADILNAALTEMTGATSPRLHLELMIARVLIPASDDSTRGALARVERLERRIGVDGAGAGAGPAPADGSGRANPRADVPAVTAPAVPASAPAPPAGLPSTGAAPAPQSAAAAKAAAPESSPAKESNSAAAPATPPAPASVTVRPVGPVTFQQVKDAWPEVLEAVQAAKTSAWLVLYTAKALELREGDLLVLSFPSQKDVEGLKQPAAPGQGVGDFLKRAINDVLGFTPRLTARVDRPGGPDGHDGRGGNGAPSAPPTPAGPSASARTEERAVPERGGAETNRGGVGRAAGGATVPATEPAPPTDDDAPPEADDAPPDTGPESGDRSGPAAAPASASETDAPSSRTLTAPASPAPATPAPATPAPATPAPSTPAPATRAPATRAPSEPTGPAVTAWATAVIPGSASATIGQPEAPTAAQPTAAQPTAAQPTAAQPTAAQPAQAAPAPAQAAPPAPAAASAATAVPSASPAGATHNDPGAPSFDDEDEPPPYDDGDVPQDDEYPPDRFVPSRRAASVAVATVAPAGTATRTAPTAPTAPAPVGGAARRGPAFAEKQRYGESVVREILGATFLEEQEHIPASRSRGD